MDTKLFLTTAFVLETCKLRVREAQMRLDSDSILAAALRFAPLAAPFVVTTGETKDRLVNMLFISFIMLLMTLLFSLLVLATERATSCFKRGGRAITFFKRGERVADGTNMV